MIEVIIIIIVVLLLIYYYTPNRVDINIDGRKWRVSEEYKNSIDAAKLLSQIHYKMLEFLRYLRDKYNIDETDEEGVPIDDDIHKIVGTLLDNYNPDVFIENDPRYSSDTSYTINKGDRMYICLRKRNDPSTLEDPDLIFFVMLHECAHIANYNGWGHDERYWEVFKFILHEACESGLYKPIDFDKYPRDYCGLKIYYNPLNDNSLANIWER